MAFINNSCLAKNWSNAEFDEIGRQLLTLSKNTVDGLRPVQHQNVKPQKYNLLLREARKAPGVIQNHPWPIRFDGRAVTQDIEAEQ